MQGKEVATSTLNKKRSRHHLAVATTAAKNGGRDIIQRLRHPLQRPEGRDIIQWSRHQIQRVRVATSLSGRDISSKEKRSRQHLAVATSDPRNAKDKSRPNKSLCEIAETTEVATKNRGCDINNKMGQLT